MSPGVCPNSGAPDGIKALVCLQNLYFFFFFKNSSLLPYDFLHRKPSYYHTSHLETMKICGQNIQKLPIAEVLKTGRRVRGARSHTAVYGIDDKSCQPPSPPAEIPQVPSLKLLGGNQSSKSSKTDENRTFVNFCAGYMSSGPESSEWQSPK